jgi:hypothetical protein
MKWLDTTMDTQTGKFIQHARPLGTVTEGMVIKRAKEISVIKGRNGNDYTQDDFEEARRELVGFPDTAPVDAENDGPDTGGRLAEAGDRGAEDLVKQGVEEATHDQMLAGSQESRERDKI